MALKLLHTADWHLGQTFFGYDREAEHDRFLDWLINTLREQHVDVLLIAGDVFDVANPSAAAQRRFYDFLRDVSLQIPNLQIIIVAGNHDSAARLEAPAPLLEALNVRVVGIVKRKDTGEIDFDSLLIPLHDKTGRQNAWCMAVPYLRQGDYPPIETDDDNEIKNSYVQGISRMYRQLFDYANKLREPGQALIAMGHLHATGADLSEDDRSERVLMGGLESVPSDAFNEQLAYTALGHIHKAQRVGGRETVRYAGSPLPMSFSEQHYKHQVVLITLEEEQAATIDIIPIPVSCELLRLPLKPGSPDEIMTMLQDLPDKSDDMDYATSPYLEIRVLLTEPDPGFRHRVEEVLQQKAVRLAAIVPSYPKRDDLDTFNPQSYKELQQMNPLDMLRHAFNRQYGTEMPETYETMFNDVMREVNS